MLGRLIQGYAKSNASLESATEELHSRSLLWPQHPSDFGRGVGSSPPATPIGSPSFRTGPYDDRGGLELNESRDTRMIIAQDAFGSMDKPMVLFDSHRREKDGHLQFNVQSGPVTSRPSRLGQSPQAEIQQRSRSTTFSGPPNTWSSPNKDVEGADRVGQLLDCMFGVTSATKSESSTKMHVLFSGQDGSLTQKDTSPVSPLKSPMTRGPLSRSRTSNQIPVAQRLLVTPKDDISPGQDTVLVTRMFSVPLPESKEPLLPAAEDGDVLEQDQESPVVPTSPSDARGKKPKLVEKKTPMFAIGFLFYLPPGESRTAIVRPPSRTSFASASLPNSYTSDIASSWTLLEAIPESLASSQSHDRGNDRRVELITNIWDVILRSLSHMEQKARLEIQSLLQQVDRDLMNSLVKSPKGPKEQRTNQRNICIRTPSALAHIAVIEQACRHILRRICYALRIPKAITGLGFVDGHWLDEARYLVQICGSKQQQFFLFNLLTAFLGNHTEWLEKLGPEWYKKQFHALSKKRQNLTLMASRTVIIADRRSIARRLIFLLASFLPTRQGLNALERDGLYMKSPSATPGLATSSPSQRVNWHDSPQVTGRHRSRGQHVSFGNADAVGLSTSASSAGSVALSSSARKEQPRHYLARKDSDTGSVRISSMLPIGNVPESLRKTSATNSAVTPNPATPIPYFSTKTDSYFPESAITDSNDSVASAGLARILRQDSSSYAHSSGPSTAWGSLISNMSGLFAKKGESAGESNPETSSFEGSGTLRTAGSGAYARLQQKSAPNRLEMMVDEAHGHYRKPSASIDDGIRQAPVTSGNTQPLESSCTIEPPRLRVDDKDGVVDVDVGIQGFLSWTETSAAISPPAISHHSPSVKSLDGVASIYSTMSHSATRTKDPNSDGLNVAGFLKRYHEDFNLQAVRPYDELEEDIRQSMSRETTPPSTPCCCEQGMEDESGDGEWITVCSTLVADMRKFSIRRISLRRKRVCRPGSSTERPQSSDFFQMSAQTSTQPEEQFITEPVGDFDTTLTDAIEGILGDAQEWNNEGKAPLKTSHSRTISGSSTVSTTAKSTTPPTTASVSSSAQKKKPPQALRADCRQVVAGALEEVVRSVNDDLNKHHKGRDIQGSHAAVSAQAKQAIKEEMKHENILREGVKKWMLNVETRSVW